MLSKLIDPIYLPFSSEQLLEHFAPVRGEISDSKRHLKHYLGSASRYIEFLANNPDRRGITLKDAKYSCQIEKDERFWGVTCLMNFYHNLERLNYLSQLMTKFYGDVPPITGIDTWQECFEGDLHLFFEVNLPSPRSYKQWLAENIESRQIIPYIQYASLKRGSHDVRTGLEGPTHVDAMLINEDNGFAIFLEAKVLSDTSYMVSFDTMRNQIIRNIDVMLDKHPELPEPLCHRDPERTLFVLLTPQIFRDNPHSRLYGLLMNEYQENPAAVQRDLPHRERSDWSDISRRMSWLTWEDFEQVLPGTCPWLSEDPLD